MSLGLSLAAAGGWTALILGALAGAAVVGLAADAVRAGRPARPGWWVAPAVGVGAWLLVAPGSWGWVTVAGPTGLGSYDVGAARALAAGMLFVEGGLLLSRRRRRWYARASLGRAQSTDDHN